MFQCQAIRGKKEEKNIPFRQNVVVGATFLDFQANIFPFLFKPRNRNFPIQGFRTRCTFCFDLIPFLGAMGFLFLNIGRDREYMEA
jgi:hypothetical protein